MPAKRIVIFGATGGTVQFRGFESPSISRADVARFMLDQLDHPTFLRQCPILY
ncbi:hypothetical protein [Persicitalea sp.]|uniref:hypothetical protein n=1 Tax=Persicitalea sp. TaxID=3100273 RepID=UPI00359329B4